MSAKSIKIGVAYPDLSALKALGPEFDNGDVQGHWRGLVDGWRKGGLLPVAGRDVELTFATYNVLNLEEQRSACNKLVVDDKVFAVVGVAYFAVGSECVAREMRTPLITADGPADEVFARSAPNLFSVSPSSSRVLRNLPHFMAANGLIKGKKIGIYHYDDTVARDLINNTLVRELKRLGNTPIMFATRNTLGGPEDAVAVRRFQEEGVNLVLLTTSKAGFLQQADGQGYKPAYVESDFEFGTSDTNTSRYSVNQFEGTLAFTGSTRGRAAAKLPMPAEAEACIRNYERYSGRTITRPAPGGKETAEYGYILISCDEGKILLEALRRAGTTLNNGALISALESLRGITMVRFATVSYSRTKHHGVDLRRSMKWHGSCTCFHAVGGFAPMWVP